MDAHALNEISARQLGGLLDPIFGTPTQGTNQTPKTPITSSSSSTTPSSSTSSTSSSTSSVPTTTSSTTSVADNLTTDAPVVLGTSTIPGRTHTVILGGESATGSPSPSATAAPQATSFLQNKVLSGVVFGIAGFVGLILIIFLATFFLRRRRNNRLLDEASAFDPVSAVNAEGYDDHEKGRVSSSVGHGTLGGEVKHSPGFDQYIPPVPYLPPMNNNNSNSLYQNQAASLSSGQVYLPPPSWGSPPPQSSQTSLTMASPRESTENYYNRMGRTRSLSGPKKAAIPPEVRRHYDNM